MLYSNSIKQTIHIIGIAKVLNYLKVNREVQVPLPVRTVVILQPLPSKFHSFNLHVNDSAADFIVRGCVFNHPIPFEMENEILN